MEQNILERILEGTMEPTDLPLETLRKITDNFSGNRIIGEGGFGTVYKGVLQNGDVAVKKIMSSMTIDEKLFRREVDSLMEANHQNVVKFLGFCSHTVHTTVKNPESRGYIYAEKRERLICFEYISNGSLDKHITDELRGLEWDTRYKIIKGICAGLYYLHMEKCILHMDLKPANILLDHNMVPKITDFGLSRPTENSRTMSTDHFSTPGYGAPENLFGHGRMCVKSDIYSLGRIITELVTGHKGILDDNNNNKVLRRWKHRWNKSATETPLAYQQQLIKCIKIGIMCQSIDPYKRPFISDIMNEIGEMENMNNHISDAPTIRQINSSSWEDDMLGVEPLELQFSNSDHNGEHISSSCSVELSNNTKDSIAFNIQTTSPLPYSMDPNNNIVPPRSKLSVDITLQEATHNHDKALSRYNTKQYEEQFVVRSIKVNDAITVEDINQDMFDRGEDVDEVHLTVVSEAPLQATSCVILSEEPCRELWSSTKEQHNLHLSLPPDHCLPSPVAMSKKIVLKIDITADKCKAGAMSKIAGILGIKSMAVDGEKGTLTVVGDVDVVYVAGVLRKAKFRAVVVSVGLEPEEKKPDTPKKPEERRSLPTHRLLYKHLVTHELKVDEFIFKQLTDTQQFTSLVIDNRILRAVVEGLRVKVKLAEELVARLDHQDLSPAAALNTLHATEGLAGLDFWLGVADDLGSMSLAQAELVQLQSSMMQSMASLESLEHSSRMPGGGDSSDVSAGAVAELNDAEHGQPGEPRAQQPDARRRRLLRRLGAGIPLRRRHFQVKPKRLNSGGAISK